MRILRAIALTRVNPIVLKEKSIYKLEQDGKGYFKAISNVTSGCPQNAITINAPPSVLQLDETSVVDQCVTVHISIATASQFTVSESVALGSTSTQSVYNAYASVTNSDDAIVGQLIGDGVSIDYSEIKYMDHFKLCLVPRNDILQDKKSFEIYDFGIR